MKNTNNRRKNIVINKFYKYKYISRATGAAPGKEPHLEPLPASTGEVEPHSKRLREQAPILEAVLPNIFQNGSSSTTEAALLEESEPELFLEEPEP